MDNTALNEIKKEEENLLCKTYTRYPIAVDKALGSKIWDYDGNEYIDLLAGIAVTAVGHCHPKISEVLYEQSKKLVHVSNLFYQKEQLDLAKRILNTIHCNKVFFCNSGAEANEAAIKIARRYQQIVNNKEAYEVITFQGCFHGRTLATVAATGQERLQKGFYPMPDGFVNIPYGCIESLKKSISSKTAAVLFEIIQGEGGIRPASKEFVENIAKICKEHNILFMIDEVQAGFGRTGKWWAFQHYNIKPDVVTTAKALANGLPMGAMMVTDEVAKAFDFGSHATTFGGGALLSAVASKTIDIINEDNLIERAATLGEWAINRFLEISKKMPNKIKEVRGRGLMIGIELNFEGKAVWEKLINKGFILNLTQERVLRLVPAYNIEKEALEKFAVTLEDILKDF